MDKIGTETRQEWPDLHWRRMISMDDLKERKDTCSSYDGSSDDSSVYKRGQTDE